MAHRGTPREVSIDGTRYTVENRTATDVFRAGAEQDERCVLGSQAATFSQFAAAIDEGDTVSCGRTGGTETFVLVTDT